MKNTVFIADLSKVRLYASFIKNFLKIRLEHPMEVF